MIFSILTFGMFFSFLIVSANGYVQTFKISKGNINFYKYTRNEMKIFLLSILKNKKSLRLEHFIIKYVGLCSSVYIVFEIVNKKFEFERNGFLALFVIYIFLRLTDILFAKNKRDYIEKIKISYISLFLITFNYFISLYLLEGLESYKILSIIIKIQLFLNIVFVLYLFDHLTRLNNVSNSVTSLYYDKLIVFYVLFSLFVHLNSFNKTTDLNFKIIYYSLSILLIEFMVTYVKKNIGDITSTQLLRFSTNHIALYFLLTVSLLVGARYVL